ncbi:hypothetical protein GCM10028792_38890 [Salinisphaera aquimarina]
MAFDFIQFAVDIRDYRCIIFGRGHLDQLGAVIEGGQRLIHRHDDLFQARLLLPERLCLVGRLSPDLAVGKFGVKLCQSFAFFRVVKDTPGGRSDAREASPSES